MGNLLSIFFVKGGFELRPGKEKDENHPSYAGGRSLPFGGGHSGHHVRRGQERGGEGKAKASRTRENPGGKKYPI